MTPPGLAACTLVALAGCGSPAGPANLGAEVPWADLGPLAAWGVDEVTVPSWSEHDERVIVARSGARVARVRVVLGLDGDQAQERIAREVALLQGLYETRLPPYPEFLTQQAGCPEQYAPRTRALPEGSAALLWADERLEYGACSPETAVRPALHASLACPAAFLRVEVFEAPGDDGASLAAIADALRCGTEGP